MLREDHTGDQHSRVSSAQEEPKYGIRRGTPTRCMAGFPGARAASMAGSASLAALGAIALPPCAPDLLAAGWRTARRREQPVSVEQGKRGSLRALLPAFLSTLWSP